MNSSRLAFGCSALLFALVFQSAPAAQAQEERDSTQTFVIGVKSWYASWDDLEGTGAKFDPAFMFGPTAVFRSSRFIAGATFLTGSFNGLIAVQDQFGNVFVSDIDVGRNDLDLYAGYRIQRYVNLVAGFKRIDYNIEFKSLSGQIPDFEVGVNSFSGGVNLAKGFENGLILSGSFNLLYNISDDNNLDEIFEGPVDLGYDGNIGFNAEGNVGYRIRGTGVVPVLGYRFQSIKGEDDSDNFSGLTVAVLYQF